MIQFVTCSQGRFAYLSWGEEAAPLLLCLHGFPDTPHSFARFAEDMASRGYRVVAPFLRGYSPSVLGGSMAPEQLSADVIALTEYFSPGKPCFLLGHDWGAAIAYLAVSENPQRFSRVVTMSVPHPVTFLQSLLRSPAQVSRSWYMFFFQLGPLADLVIKRDNFALIEKLWRKWSPGYEPGEVYWRDLKECLSQSMPYPVDYYRNMFWPPKAALARLKNAKKISTPLLYLHGAQDGCISRDSSRGQEHLFSGELRQGVIEGAGHFIQVEAPDLLAQEVVAWLRSPI